MKIVVGYDGSKRSEKALDLAIRRAKALRLQPLVYLVFSLHGEWEDEQAEVIEAERKLEYAKERFNEEQISCETHLLIRGATPGEDIVQFAEERNVDEIILGIKRRSAVGKLLFGSNVRHVMLNAPCPVTTVR